LIAVGGTCGDRGIQKHQGARADAAQVSTVAIDVIGRHPPIVARTAPLQQHAAGGQPRITGGFRGTGRLRIRCDRRSAGTGAGGLVGRSRPVRRLSTPAAAG
jgi:hypothetical protein